MRDYVLSHVGNEELLRGLGEIASKDREVTAALLAHLAEVDARRLHAPAGHPSMESYCIHQLHFSEDVAHKRIRAARKAREYPAIFEMVADGRLSLSAVLSLSSWLRPENAAELLAAAAHRSSKELAELIAERFPRTEVLPLVVAVVGAGVSVPESSCQVAARPPVVRVSQNVAPIAGNRYVLQVSISKDTHDKLEYAQALMSHVAGCDLARVFDRALDTLIGKLERDRCGAASRSSRRRPTLSRRHIPNHVKKEVWKRDGGQCTFTTESGHRCPSRHQIEYDHIEPVARGGEATVENVRLRCRTHNQYEAERAFGVEFIAEKRQAAKRERAVAREQKQRAAQTSGSDADLDVTPWLRQLRCRPDDIRLAARHCETLPPGMSLEDRVEEAIRFVGRVRFPKAARQSEASRSAASE